MKLLIIGIKLRLKIYLVYIKYALSFLLVSVQNTPSRLTPYAKEVLRFYKSLLIHNASINTDENLYKMQFTLLRENHVIEKGMSLRNPKLGFGQEKVLQLIERLKKYIYYYYKDDPDFLKYPLSTIANYIKCTKKNGIEIPEIEQKYDNILLKAGIKDLDFVSGITKMTKAHIHSLCDKNFESLLQSRHSIRYFTSEIPTKNEIIKALMLARWTPSACNRQSWKTHVFFGNESHNLLKWQNGANGFEDEIHCSILVTADLRAFLEYELFQAYIDGGMYAINLINALHSLGLGTIPLSCGFLSQKLKLLTTDFGIPDNEVPIVIVGVGYLLDDFNIAVSKRKDIKFTNSFH